MITWFLARHGQTKWNVEGRLQGWLDSPLTEKGVEGALQLGRLLSHQNFDQIYVSTSGRALQTLSYAFGEDVLKVSIKEPRLREICLGDWQGQKNTEIMKKEAEKYTLFLKNSLSFVKDDSESYQDLYRRIDAFVNEVEAKHTLLAKKANHPQNILVVTHGITLMMLEARFSQQGISAISNLTVAPNATPMVYRKNQLGYEKIDLHDL